MEWPQYLPVQQVRIARQTDKIDEMKKFYIEGLGLQKIMEFEGHQGYNGIMVGLPGVNYHLEFISHIGGSPGDAPSKENLLVLYFNDAQTVTAIAERLTEMGYNEVKPENPYWENISITITDPDGWRVVLVENPGFSAD
ncbi:MAG: VOC family protein [Candidatus Kariarchaeaceae archaeon]